MQGGLFFGGQIVEIVRHGQPLAFLRHTDLRPVGGQGRQGFLLLRFQGLPARILWRLRCYRLAAWCVRILRRHTAQPHEDETESDGEKTLYFQSDTFAGDGLDFK